MILDSSKDGMSRRGRGPDRPALPPWLNVLRLIVGIVAPIGGVVLGVILIVSGWHTRSEERPVAGWATATGSVVKVDQVSVRDGYTYKPVIAFTDARGRHYTFTAPASSDQPSIGDAAQVSYNPDAPSQAHDLSDGGDGWAAPFVTGIMITSVAGLLALFTGGYLMRRWLRRH